jgi:hypothetical protein
MYKQFKIYLILIIVSGFLLLQNSIFGQQRIAILYSELTNKFGSPNSAKVIDIITSWELFLMQEKIPYSVVYEDELEAGIEDEFDILILPSVEIISDAEIEKLKEFLTVGKSIICSGSKLFTKENILDKYQNLKSLFGINDIEFVPSEKLSYLHSLIPSNLNQFRIDGELILQISNQNQALVADLSENQYSTSGYVFENSNLNSKKSSIIYGTVGLGKFLWTGFDLPDVIGGNEDLKAFKNLIFNSIHWMGSEPDIYLDIFCDSLSHPVIVTLQYSNALDSELIDVLQKNSIRPNLIVSPEPKVPREILSKFSSDEIIFDLSQFSDLTSNTVNELTDNFNRDYEIILSSIIVEKQFIVNGDFSLTQGVGIDKILYNEQVPELPKFANNDLLIIPFVKSIEILNCGSVVNFLNYDPKINCEGNPEDELLETINQIKSQKNNFISLTSLKRWWNVRKRVTAEIKNVSDDEIEIWLSNNNSVSISDLNIFLNYAGRIDKKSLTISQNNSLLRHEFSNTSGAIVIKSQDILPNSVNKIKLNFTLE